MMRIAATMELASISRQPASPGSNASVTQAGLERVAQDVSGHVYTVVSMQCSFHVVETKIHTWEYQCNVVQ